ncbi:venom serine carboxypeptidase [Condylostylus longicornis]|uniref:venom serine carboxypeptidase n=1 Tax=Condylostylus longicornis TaxID=2530218 RepID=UPI00244E4803|nr:venom serine carboxypeptidase [Condylostylus longicornis]
MKLFILILINIYFSITSASFINVYPKFKSYNDGGDPGEPLYLTPYIEKGKLDVARNLSQVNIEGFPSIQSFSGYLNVNKSCNANMFFWYFVSESSPESSPVVVWLQGGPGASSLFGLFAENGPFQVDKDGKLGKRKYTWSKNHHLIYIDNPVGTGFSFTDSAECYAKNEKDVGRDLYEVMQQFFTLFPELQKLDFWVTGESYGGKYVPALAYKIHRENQNSKQNPPRIHINMKGVAIGNGLSDPLHQLKYSDYLYQIGLIDINGRDLFRKKEKEGTDCIKKHDMDCAFEVFDSLIDMDQTPTSLFQNLTGFQNYYDYLNAHGETPDSGMEKLLQSSTLRAAVHVGNNTFNGLDGENKVEVYLKRDIMDTVAPWVAELLKTYRVCIYNGQLDIIVAYPLTLNYLQKLKFEGAEIYRTAPRYVWKIDGDIAGYAKEAANLVEVLVRNAGHMVPANQPKWAFDLITRLTNNKGFGNEI